MRTKKTIVVLISGLAGVGKTTLSDILYEKLSGLSGIKVDKYSFAGPLKMIAGKYLKWDGLKDSRGRKLLQKFGGIAREYDENIWASYLFTWLDAKGIFPLNFVLVDDWRFINEANYVASNPLTEAFPVRIVGRESTITDEELLSDASETGLPESGDYHYVDNSGTIDELTANANALVEELKKLYIVE